MYYDNISWIVESFRERWDQKFPIKSRIAQSSKKECMWLSRNEDEGPQKMILVLFSNKRVYVKKF